MKDIFNRTMHSIKKATLFTLCLLLLFTAGAVWGVGASSPEIKSPAVKKALSLLDTPSPENFEKARALLIDLLKKNPKDVDAHMGMVHLRITEHTLSPQPVTGGLQEALKHVDAALQIKPDLEDAYRIKSLILLFLGRREEGLAVLESALKRWPGSQELHEAYVACLIHLGKIQEAERFSDLEGSRVKNKRDLLLRLGEVWLQSGYVEQAVECFEHSLNLEETPQAWAAIGRSFAFKKEYPEAIDFFQKALAIDPKYYTIYNDLSFCYVQSGRLREATQWMERYVQAYPNDMTALVNLAGLYEGNGEKIKARLTWMKVKANSRDPQQASLATERLEKLKSQK